jgi:hypothetical protein
MEYGEWKGKNNGARKPRIEALTFGPKPLIRHNYSSETFGGFLMISRRLETGKRAFLAKQNKISS